MEQALHVIKVSKYEGMDVQTSLFSYRMSTRIFLTAGAKRVPLEIIEKVKELQDSTDLIDKVFVTADAEWDDYHSVYSQHLFTGIEVETFSFQDAGYIHAAVGKIVEDFMKDHEQVVTFVRR